MKIVASVQFIFKFFLAISLLIAIKYLSRNVQRGFICGDPSLSLDRKPDTIPNLLLVFWGISPIIVLMACEMFFNFEKAEHILGCFKRSWANTAHLCHPYFVNVLLMHFVIGSAKFFTGAHRPHFFETCQPDRMLNCTLGTFVSQFECTNANASKVNIADASMSFFSGHAATCVFSCLFVCWYLQNRSKSQSLFLIPFVQTSLICLAYFGSISRVFDHRHHWWDVLTGAIFGVLTTYHTCYVLCKNRCTKPQSEKLPTDINNTFLDESRTTTC